jgi:hypothetical protein
MPRYMMVYKGPATDMADMTEEQANEVMGKWAVWMQDVGAAMVDMGTPFGPGKSLVDDGSEGTAGQLNGYSVVEADDMDGAAALAKGHPFLSDGTGDFAIDIYELLPAPGM